MRTTRRGNGSDGVSTNTVSRSKCYVARSAHFGAHPAEIASLYHLPPVPKRWVAHRKAEVIAAVSRGIISLDDALQRYALTIDEYLAWQRSVRLLGLPGLSVNRLQRERPVRGQPANALSKQDGSQYASFNQAGR